MQDSKLRLINTSEHSDKPDQPEAPRQIVDDIPEDSERLAELVDIEGSGRKETAFKYGVIASVIFHIIFFVVLVKVAYYRPTNSVLKPGEKLTKVRLVELPESKKTDQPPPKQFSAFSDRNNTAVKKRLPKRSTGSPVPMRPAPPKRMAMIKPPPAPEFQDKPKKKPKPPAKKSTTQAKRETKPATKNKTLINYSG